MSEYNLNINGEIRLEDYSNISDYIGLVGDNDKFTIIMDVENKQDRDIICCMIQNSGFKIISKEEKDKKIYVSYEKDLSYQLEN